MSTWWSARSRTPTASHTYLTDEDIYDNSRTDPPLFFPFLHTHAHIYAWRLLIPQTGYDAPILSLVFSHPRTEAMHFSRGDWRICYLCNSRSTLKKKTEKRSYQVRCPLASMSLDILVEMHFARCSPGDPVCSRISLSFRNTNPLLVRGFVFSKRNTTLYRGIRASKLQASVTVVGLWTILLDQPRGHRTRGCLSVRVESLLIYTRCILENNCVGQAIKATTLA